MDVNTIAALISSVGFPIVVACYLLLNQKESAKQHEEESKGFIQAIDNNTQAITRLLDKLDKED